MCVVNKDNVVQSPFHGNQGVVTKSLSSSDNTFSSLVTCKINECETHTLVASGSQVTIINFKLYESLMKR